MQTTSAYSAFGSTTPLYDASGDRVRWFCPAVIDSDDALEACLREAGAAQQEHGANRATLRVLFHRPPGVKSDAVIESMGFRLEASMPLSDGRSVCYLARNLPGRKPDSVDTAREDELLRDILHRPARAPAQITATFEQRGDLSLQRLDAGSLDKDDRQRLIAMHRQAFPTFPYDFAAKLQLMLDSPRDYLLCGIRSIGDGKLLAFSNLELNRVSLDNGGTLRLAEYDNTMRVGMSGDPAAISGIGAIVRLRLAQWAAGMEVDLCHGESRAGLAAINRISHDIGMRYGGRLEQHLLISGRRDIDYRSQGQFESMNVWYLNRDHLAALIA